MEHQHPSKGIILSYYQRASEWERDRANVGGKNVFCYMEIHFSSVASAFPSPLSQDDNKNLSSQVVLLIPIIHLISTVVREKLISPITTQRKNVFTRNKENERKKKTEPRRKTRPRPRALLNIKHAHLPN
jgi:hypothetical protein